MHATTSKLVDKHDFACPVNDSSDSFVAYHEWTGSLLLPEHVHFVHCRSSPPRSSSDYVVATLYILLLLAQPMNPDLVRGFFFSKKGRVNLHVVKGYEVIE